MALKIRLRQQGCTNRQTYRVVVADARCRRDGKYVEKLGWYLPHLTENNCSIDEARMNYWLEQGAQMSDQVKSLAEKNAPSVLKNHRARQDEVAQRRIIRRREKKKVA
jgi:small subunit ribosomal protein S16